MIGIIVDVIIVIILLIYLIFGVVRGLVKSVLSLISSMFSLTIATFCSKFLTKLLQHLFGMTTALTNAVHNVIGADTVTFFGVTCTAEQIGTFLANGISTAIIFIAIVLVIYIIEKIFTSLSQISVTFNITNRILGGVFNLAKGVLMIGLILGIISLFSTIPGLFSILDGYIAQSTIGSGLQYLADKAIAFVIQHWNK